MAKGQTEVQVLELELKKVKEQLLKYDNEEKERQHKMRYYQTQIDKYQHVGYMSYRIPPNCSTGCLDQLWRGAIIKNIQMEKLSQ